MLTRAASLRGKTDNVPHLPNIVAFFGVTSQLAGGQRYVPSRFDVDLEIVKLYLESAKTYMELSIALVGLTVVFREKILGSKKLPEVQILTICSGYHSCCRLDSILSISMQPSIFLTPFLHTQQRPFSQCGS